MLSDFKKKNKKKKQLQMLLPVKVGSKSVVVMMISSPADHVTGAVNVKVDAPALAGLANLVQVGV